MDAQPASILVVDDDEAIRDLCTRILGRAYRVRAVADGPAALQAARAEPPDLLLADIRMPGMSGLEAARRIVAENPEVSVVVMTGVSEFDSLLETVKLGVNGFLMKPFTPDDLRRTVEEGLRKGLYHRRNARLRALQPLLDLRSARPGGVEPARLHQVITETVLHELAADAVSLVCVEEDGSGVRVTTSTAGPGGPATVQGDGATSSAVRLSPDDLLQSLAADEDDGHTLSVPLQVGGAVVGILTASREREPFGGVDRDVARVIAAQGAIALENIRLFQQLRQSYWKMVYALAATVDLRDQPTRGHSDRLAQYAVAIGARLGLSAERLEDLRIAALLHDIGKIGIGDAILRKPTDLTPEEYDWMKTHTLMGAKILAMADFPPRVVEAVLFHHERFDGTGYPLGLQGDHIPLEARILAGADALESMTSTRAYRAAMPLAHALAELERGRGSQFDPQVLDALLACLRAGELAPLTLPDGAGVAGERGA
jgi:putative nucleotidyltransferase with HDIG domain